MLIRATTIADPGNDDRFSVVHRPRSFAVALANGELPRIAKRIADVVADSFSSHPMRNVTRSEVVRRGEICAEAFRTLQGELKWSTDRALSYLRHVLTSTLNGVPWKPPTRNRTLWSPIFGDDM